MKLTKNLICLTLASCVAHASVASQAILTKDLVIKSTDEIISDSQSAPTSDAERDQMQNMDGTLKTKLELLPAAQEESAVTQISGEATCTTAKEKRVTKQKQPQKKTSKGESSTSITDGMEGCVAGQSQETSAVSAKKEKVVDQPQKLSANSDSGALSNDGTMEQVTPTSTDTEEQEQSEVATTRAKSTTVKTAIEDESVTEQKQIEEKITKLQSPTVSDDQEKNVAKVPETEAVVSSQEKNSLGQEQKAEKISEGENGTTVAKDLEEQRDMAVNAQKVAKRSTYADKKYVAEALNLIDPYIYHLTKVTQNFRFCDGSKEKIFLNNLSWRYQDDEGKGSTNYMKLLFPSNAGVLSTETSANRKCFSVTCKPTANLIADMECYFHNYARNPVHSDKAQKYLTEIITENLESITNLLLRTEAKHFFEKNKIDLPKGKKSKPQIDEKNIDSILNSDDKFKLVDLYMRLNSKKSIKSKNEKVRVQKKLEALFENIKDGTFDYFPVEHFVTFEKDKKKYEFNINSFKLVLELLNEGSYMIKSQESNGSTSEKILPKYMTERMLMTYFFFTKSEESDITKFYSRVKEKLGDNIVDPSSPKEALDKLSKRAKMIEELKFNDNSPYKDPVVANANTFRISTVDEHMKVTLQKQTFQDCVDIATRHIINLLMYDKKSQWSRLLDGVDRDKLKPELEEILKAIEQHKSVEFKTLKERLQLFFLHQESVGADAADINTRSLWNYAISNMNQEKLEGLYPIEYTSGKNYELASGFDNSLKILYNIACALDISSSEKRDQAKKAIDKLIHIENDEGTKRLKNAIEAIYKLFNENINIVESDSYFKLSSNKNKWIGKTSAFYNNEKFFVVDQQESHAEIIFDPVEKYSFNWLDKNKEDIFQDDMIALLVCNRINIVEKEIKDQVFEIIEGIDDPEKLEEWRCKFSEKIPLFYKLCTWANGSMEKSTMIKFDASKYEKYLKYITNFKVLKFLRGVQGEQDNGSLINAFINYCLNDNFHFDNITFGFVNLKDSVSMFIIDNYFLKTGQLNPEEKPWGETLKHFNPANVITYDKMEYYCATNGDKVILYPTCTIIDSSEVRIPAIVTLNDNEYKVVALGAFAFFDAKLTKVTFEEGLEDFALGNLAFGNCSELTAVQFPTTLKRLRLKSNFFNCPKLTTVNLPVNIERLSLGGSFSRCKKLKPIDISTLKSMEKLHISKTDHLILQISSAITMPSTLKTLQLDPYTFFGLESLHTFKLNDGLKKLHVKHNAFAQTALESFKIPASVTDLKIEGNVFDSCKYLKELVLPDKKESIEVSEDIRALSDQLKTAKV